MATLNQVQLIGYVGNDPKILPTRNGKDMASFSLGTTDREIKRQDGTTIPAKTEWHEITVFGNAVKFIADYIRKGSQLFVQGALRYRTYNKQDGSKGYATEIVADTVQLLDRKADKGNANIGNPASTANDNDFPF